MERLVRHEVKAVETGGTAAKGYFEALVAVFGNVDSYGDVLAQGAFTQSIEKLGFPRSVWSHQWSIPPIGTTDKAEEISEGLVVGCQLFVDQGIELIDHIYLAMAAKNGDGRSPLREFSFGYDVDKYSWEESTDPAAAKFGGEVRTLEVISCYEAGPCLVGVNPETELLAVKGIEAPKELEDPTRPRSGAKSTPIPDRDAIDRLVMTSTGRP